MSACAAGVQPAPWPKVVMLELTNACDLKCRHCPFHGDGVQKQRPVLHMSEALWRRALAEVVSWGVPIEVQPWAMGEPLLHPDLWEFVRTAKRAPQVRVGFYSNGNQWTASDFAAAFETGLDWVCFSIDGVRRDVFEHYRVGASLERVLASLHGLGAERRRRGVLRPQIRVNMVEYPELADHGAEFVQAMRGAADQVMVSRFRTIGVRKFSPVALPRVPCFQLDTLLAMCADGRVGQCCEDQQVEAPMGSFPAQSLAEIWRGPGFEALRQAHRQGRYDASPLCKDCDAWTGAYDRTHRNGDVLVREKTAGTVHEFRTGSRGLRMTPRALIPSDLVPLCARVTAAFEVLRDEALRVPDAHYVHWPDYTLDREGWLILPFILRHGAPPAGFHIEQNQRACPRSFALLSQHSNILVAGFSRMLPGGRVGRHRDYPFPNVLRFHLGLRLKPGAGIHMEDVFVPNPLGSGVLFDASLEHYTTNPTDEPRDLLLLDILLQPDEIAALVALRGRVNLGPTSADRDATGSA